MQLTPRASQVLAHSGVILTANPRGARHIQQIFHQTQQRSGHQSWAAPQVFAFSDWLEHLWQQICLSGGDDRLLLSPLAMQRIWERVLRDHNVAGQVLTLEGLTESAVSAWDLLFSFGDMRALRQHASFGDAASFATWAEHFLQLSNRERWIDAARLPHALAGLLRAHPALLRKEVLLVGFDRLPPSIERVLAALTEAGCSVALEDFATEATPATTAALRSVAAETPELELLAFASWARDLLLAEPDTRINFIVPDVRTARPALDRILRQVLAPETLRDIEPSPLPYEFSLGTPLAEIAMVRCALLLLAWGHGALPLDEISWLLHCTYSGTDDVWTRARFDAGMMRSAQLLRLEGTLAWTQQALEKMSGRWPLLLRSLMRLAAAEHLEEARTAEFSHWVEVAEKFLAQAQWPGQQPLDSTEHQVESRWQSLLQSLARLDSTEPPITFRQFCAVLEKAARSVLFAPQSNAAPVQIIGAFESAGVAANAVWFGGMDEAAWPVPRSLHPLLSPTLQRALKMPGSDLQQDFALAASITRRIFSSAPFATASYSRQTGEVRLDPSPVLKQFPATHLNAAEMPRVELPAAEDRTAPFLDTSHVPWQQTRTAGGAEVLRAQAACPFSAFAAKRLRARTLADVEEGLGPGERGTMVHSVLQRFWKQVGGQSKLLAKTAEEIEAILRANIKDVIATQPVTDEWSRAFLRAEEIRLEELLLQWLEVERGRTPFSVAVQEGETEVSLGGLKLSLRMDRVDTVAESKVLIDYKTGEVNVRKWDGERIEEPQLPLYALTMDHSLSGIAFARISKQKLAIQGLEQHKGVFFPRSHPKQHKIELASLDERIEQWRTSLTEIAQEFLAGEARVDPLHGDLTCRYCGLQPLCRIAEAPPEVGEEEV